MKSRYLFPLLLLLSCSGTQHLSAQPAPNPPTPTPVVPPAPKPPAPPKPAPKVLPVAKVQMPTLVQPGQLFAITTRGSVGTGRTAIFRPELPAEATVLEMADKRTKDDAFMVTLPKGASGSYVFVFVVTQNGVAEPAVEAVPFVVGKPTPEPAPPTPIDPVDPKPVDPTPKPVPKPAGPFHVTLLDDYTKRTPATAAVITSQKIRAAATAAGHSFRMFDGSQTDDSAVLKAFAPWIAKAGGLPCVVVTEKNSTPPGKIVTQFPLPATEDAFVEAIKKAGGQ